MDSDTKRRIEAGLKAFDRQKIDELADREKVMLIMYFAGEPLKAKDIAPFIDVPESKIDIILEASTKI